MSIEDEDREAAADCLLANGMVMRDALKLIRDGKDDANPVVQAFARHRRQAEARAMDRAAEDDATVERVASFIHDARWKPGDSRILYKPFAEEDQAGREYCLRLAAAAIRTLGESHE